MLRGMDASNPYAAPRASLSDTVPDPDAELPAWRLEGQTLIARNGTTLPDVCLFSGEPTTPGQRLQVPLSWTPIWFRIMAVLAPVLAALAYSTLRKTSTIELGLGPAGRKRRRLCTMLSLAAMMAGVVLFCVAIGVEDSTLLVGLLLAALVPLIVAAVLARAFRVGKIDRRFTRFLLRPQVAAAFARLPAPGSQPG